MAALGETSEVYQGVSLAKLRKLSSVSLPREPPGVLPTATAGYSTTSSSATRV